ncbi:MAG: helix-hairpin-helix domain-containing protein [Bacteroidetes bacterium]|nr:helix-hairpin-helix domain-containing protein [Bacteroidota bacterium]
MKPFLKDYLTFSKKERIGAVYLMAIIVILFIAAYGLEYYYANFQEKKDYAALDFEIEEFIRKKKLLNDSLAGMQHKTLTVENKPAVPKYFYFDPNKATAQEWEQLGLKPKLVKTIINYTAKGGKFYKNEDVKKMYGMDEETYNALAPYIRIKPKSENHIKVSAKPEYQWEKKEEKLQIIEINAADLYELTKIKGIGESFASSIIKYRNLLGGFLYKEQLLEIYNLSPEKLAEIESQVDINPLLIKKININKCTIEELVSHPYLKWSTANSIVKIREQHGFYNHTREIQQSDLVNEELYRKLAPYLTIE